MTDIDTKKYEPKYPPNKVPAPGWVGGFAQSNEKFAYPTPDLSSIKIQGNMDNIPLLQRQMKVLWPEFSWQTVPGEDSTRCFQQFDPDISRLGYTDQGQVYSIICPQQGAYLKEIGTFNVEVTVTGNRGWADEDKKDFAADMGVQGTIWFGPVVDEYPLLKRLVKYMEKKMPTYKFPFTKADAIKVKTFLPGNPNHPNFPLKAGPTDTFTAPEFCQHWDDGAWAVGNLEVEIGGIIKTGNKTVDRCNQIILNLFNAGKGNMLKEGNILTWNVWFEAPSVVNTEEWQAHAEKWRLSIDTNHGDPDGPGSPPRFFDGKIFTAHECMAEEVAHAIEELTLFVLEKDTKKCIVV